MYIVPSFAIAHCVFVSYDITVCYINLCPGWIGLSQIVLHYTVLYDVRVCYGML